MKKFKAVLCDVDGTMVLTEARNRRLVEILVVASGGTLAEADWAYLAGKSEANIWDYMEGKFPGLPISRNEYIVICHDRCLTEEFSVAARPGMAEILSHYKAQGLHVAGVTNCPREVAVFGLESAGLFKHLDFLVSPTEVEAAGLRLKPAPDPYLLAAQMLGVAPEDCLVFEDSFTGVSAGDAAGMTVVQFCDEGSPPSDQADFHVRTADEFRPLAYAFVPRAGEAGLGAGPG